MWRNRTIVTHSRKLISRGTPRKLHSARKLNKNQGNFSVSISLFLLLSGAVSIIPRNGKKKGRARERERDEERFDSGGCNARQLLVFSSAAARRLNGAAKRFISEFKRRMSRDATAARWSLKKENRKDRGLRAWSTPSTPPSLRPHDNSGSLIRGNGYLPTIRRSA